MKFTIKQKDLIDAITTVYKFVPTKTPVSLLTGIKFSLTEDMLEIVATDLDMGIVFKIPNNGENINIEEKGSAVIDGKILSEIVRKMPSGDVKFLQDNDKIKITSGDFNMMLSCFPADDFPDVSSGSKSSTTIFSQSLFKKMVNQVIFARADDTTSRPYLTGALLDCKENVLNIVALDGFRIAWRKEELLDEKTEDFRVIIPGKTLTEISNIFSEKEDEKFELYLGKNKVEFRTENIMISSRTLQGTFIDYEKIVDVPPQTCVNIETDPLLRAIDRANILARQVNKNNLFKMSITDGQVEIMAEAELGKISDTIECNTEGEDLLIAFNARFFMDALRSIEYPTINLNFSGDTGPCIIKPEGVENHVNFILPVKLRSDD